MSYRKYDDRCSDLLFTAIRTSYDCRSNITVLTLYTGKTGFEYDAAAKFDYPVPHISYYDRKHIGSEMGHMIIEDLLIRTEFHKGLKNFRNPAVLILDGCGKLIIPYLHKVSHLPIIVDPSHACGQRWMVGDLAKSAVACNTDGLIIEVHNNPEKALCDGEQSLHPTEFAQVMKVLEQIAQINGRKI